MGTIRLEIKWAVLFTIAMWVWMIGERLVGLHDEHIDKHYIYTNFFALVAITIYVLALLDKRNNFYGGIMSWKQGFTSGLILTLCIAIVSPLAQYITSTFITPAYFDNVIEYVVEHNMQSQEEAKAYFNLKNYIIQSVIGAIIMGVITSALVALFVRRS